MLGCSSTCNSRDYSCPSCKELVACKLKLQHSHLHVFGFKLCYGSWFLPLQPFSYRGEISILGFLSSSFFIPLPWVSAVEIASERKIVVLSSHHHLLVELVEIELRKAVGSLIKLSNCHRGIVPELEVKGKYKSDYMIKCYCMLGSWLL